VLCLDRGGIKDIGTRAKQTGIPGGSAGCLEGLTWMIRGYRMWIYRISTSYRAQPNPKDLIFT
jgi:hypothetical protein